MGILAEPLALLPRLVWAARPPGRPRVPSWRPALAEGRRLSLPGRGDLSVRYVAGPPSAVPVLLLHGVTWSGDINFHRVVDELSLRHPVVVMDHRGHGFGLVAETPFTLEDLADDAVAVLDELGIPQAIVAGFSLGSLTALHVALRHPDRVSGLVLTAGALVLRDRILERTVMTVGIAGLSVAAVAGVGRSVAPRYFGLTRRRPSEDFRELWPWLRAELHRNDPRSVARALNAASRHDLRGQVASLRAVPSVVVVHLRDTLVPTRLQHQMATEVGADTIRLDADHDAPVADPAAYADALVEAVARVDAMRGLSRLTG